MWQSDSTTSLRSPKKKNQHRSNSQLNARHTSQTSLLKRALSFQFLNREEVVDKKTHDYIKMRYKDISKCVIWPSCRIETPIVKALPPKAVPEPQDPRAILFQADMEDEKTPYLPATINHVLRSDSEDSSSDEEVMYMTRL